MVGQFLNRKFLIVYVKIYIQFLLISTRFLFYKKIEFVYSTHILFSINLYSIFIRFNFTLILLLLCVLKIRRLLFASSIGLMSLAQDDTLLCLRPCEPHLHISSRFLDAIMSPAWFDFPQFELYPMWCSLVRLFKMGLSVFSVTSFLNLDKYFKKKLCS